MFYHICSRLYFKHGHSERSRDMRFPTMWYVRPAKAQTSLRIRAVWSEHLLAAWEFYDSYASDWTSFGVSKLKKWLLTLVWVYTCQNATLLEFKCHGSNYVVGHVLLLQSRSSIGSFIFLTVNLFRHCQEYLHEISNNLTSVDSDEPLEPPFKLRNSKRCLVSSFTIIEYSSDKQRLWSDCAYAQADLRLCWSHISRCKSHAQTHVFCLVWRQSVMLEDFLSSVVEPRLSRV